MRLRHDDWHSAGQRRARDLGVLDTSAWEPRWRARLWEVPPAVPGDVWRVVVSGDPGGLLCHGYVLTCPLVTCDQGVHHWHHAYDCPARAHFLPEECKLGVRPGMESCWTWTGSAEDGTLSATPSLHSPLDKGGCGFHGYLTNGVLA